MRVDLKKIVTSGSLCGRCKRPLIVTQAGKCLACGHSN